MLMSVPKRRGALTGLRSWRSRPPEGSSSTSDEKESGPETEATRTWLPTPGGNGPEQGRDPAGERALWMTLATERARSSDAVEEVPGSWLRGAPLAAEPEDGPTQSWLPAEERGPESFVSEESAAPPTEVTAPEPPPPPAPEPEVTAPEPPPPPPAPEPEPPAPEPSAAAEPEPEDRLEPRQRRAVESYCRELCPPETAAAAVDEISKSFAGGDDLDLLKYTRSVAARYAEARPARRGWRRALAAERDSECRSTPGLVAASLNGELDEGGRATLGHHLAKCVACQAAEVRAHRADRAFAALTGLTLATEVTPAMAEAPPMEAVEPEPSPAEPIAPPPVEELVAEPPVAEPELWRPTEVKGGDAEILRTAEDEGKTTEIPAAAAGVGAAAAATTAAATGDAGAHERAHQSAIPITEPATKHRRPGRRAIGAIAAALATAGVAAAVAVALISGGSKKHAAPVANTVASAPVTTPVHRAPVRHKPRPPAKKPQHPATTAAPPAPAPSTPAAASAAPSSSAPSSSSSSSSGNSSSAPSSPAPSAPAPAPAQSSGPPASSGPSVSIQQPSLGNASASQGIGSHH